MTKKSLGSRSSLKEIVAKIVSLRDQLNAFETADGGKPPNNPLAEKFVSLSGSVIADLQRVRERVSPIRFGPIGITLGRSDSIAKFFAFCFSNREKESLSELSANPFYGSGVYAIYYHGTGVAAYRPLSGTETPIYFGKANPVNPQAETVEEQGQPLFKRLREHAGNISKTDLRLEDFRYRATPIQTGMQAAVEDFMIRLFKPIWNKEVGICFGIGKHGDSAATRANKRSPWDTMHPGRKWAAATTANQLERSEIEVKIKEHFLKNPVIADKENLLAHLSLG